MSTLSGKVALVTGASRGIGRGIALRLARDGALVIVHYGRSRGAAESAVEEITRAKGQAFAVPCDLTSVAQIRAMFDRIDEELRRRVGETKLDILVNNAADASGFMLEDVTEEVFDRMCDTNFKGSFFVMQQASPRLRDGGRVVFITAVATEHSYGYQPGYAGTKGAVKTLALALATHFGPRRITVNSVNPGATRTDMIAPHIGTPALDGMVAATALGRLGEPADIAAVVSMVVGPDGGWITGQDIKATGGLWI